MFSEPRPALVAPENRVGSILNGKWTLERLIGQGGMAVVYRAVHRNRKRAAIKMLLPELSVHLDVRDRFLREGYVANSVNHRGVVRVDDDDVSEDGSAYLVMELLEGQTVQERWERLGRRMPLEQALAIADELLSVLIAAHSVGVVHRDLKPDNLYLTREGVLKVLDFGIARLRELGESSTATRTGAVMGTPAFMAPEQARGRWELVDPRTDLWAVGALLFTLITGRPVHQAETANETLALACIQRAVSVRSLAPEVPEGIAQVIDTALAYEMSERPVDAAAMQRVLRAAAGDLLSETTRASVLDWERTDAKASADRQPAAPAALDPQARPAPATHGDVPVAVAPTQLTAAVSQVAAPGNGHTGRLLWVVAALGIAVAIIVVLTRHTPATSNVPRPDVTEQHGASTLAARPQPSQPAVTTPQNEAIVVSAEPPVVASVGDSSSTKVPRSSGKTARRTGKVASTSPPAVRTPKTPDPMSLRR
jgi:tRNA A-37 threonylcarbamoyl transferase component Bud32